MFKCKVCEERNLRISDLNKQHENQLSDLRKTIEFLKQQLAPAPQLPHLNLEANYILDGGATETPMTPEQLEEQARINQEADALLTANF